MNVSDYQHIIKASTEWDRATFLRKKAAALMQPSLEITKKAAALIEEAKAIEAAINRKNTEEYE
jgi:hypothetical protein